MSRKDLKKSGLKVLKKHYIIFILLCLIAAFLGSEFSNSISITKLEKQILPKDSQVVNNVKSDIQNKAVDTVEKNTGINVNKEVKSVKK